jgi:methyltransferase
VFSLLVFLVVFVPMLIEARRAASNEIAQRERGGIEAQGDVYNAMRVVYPVAFLLMIAEGALRGGASIAVATSGLVLFAAAKTLKWWAILTLGEFWTFRVIVVPRAPLVTNGPYHLIRHPNYVAVFGELLSVALMTGARLTGPIAVVGFGLLILRRIGVEEKALRSG